MIHGDHVPELFVLCGSASSLVGLAQMQRLQANATMGFCSRVVTRDEATLPLLLGCGGGPVRIFRRPRLLLRRVPADVPHRTRRRLRHQLLAWRANRHTSQHYLRRSLRGLPAWRTLSQDLETLSGLNWEDMLPVDLADWWTIWSCSTVCLECMAGATGVAATSGKGT